MSATLQHATISATEAVIIAELQIDLKIVKAERDLCVVLLEELERRHVERYRRSNRDESDSETLRTIRRVLSAVRLHSEIAA